MASTVAGAYILQYNNTNAILIFSDTRAIFPEDEFKQEVGKKMAEYVLDDNRAKLAEYIENNIPEKIKPPSEKGKVFWYPYGNYRILGVALGDKTSARHILHTQIKDQTDIPTLLTRIREGLETEQNNLISGYFKNPLKNYRAVSTSKETYLMSLLIGVLPNDGAEPSLYHITPHSVVVAAMNYIACGVSKKSMETGMEVGYSFIEGENFVNFDQQLRNSVNALLRVAYNDEDNHKKMLINNLAGGILFTAGAHEPIVEFGPPTPRENWYVRIISLLRGIASGRFLLKRLRHFWKKKKVESESSGPEALLDEDNEVQIENERPPSESSFDDEIEGDRANTPLFIDSDDEIEVQKRLGGG